MADKLYVSTEVCLNIFHLVSAKDLLNVQTIQATTLPTLSNVQHRREKKILKIKYEQNISFPEARKQFEQFYAVQTYASAVKPNTCNKSTQTKHKQTQTDHSITNYKKETTSEKKSKRKNETKGKRTSSPRPGPALKAATLELMKKEEERKKNTNKTK